MSTFHKWLWKSEPNSNSDFLIPLAWQLLHHHPTPVQTYKLKVCESSLLQSLDKVCIWSAVSELTSILSDCKRLKFYHVTTMVCQFRVDKMLKIGCQSGSGLDTGLGPLMQPHIAGCSTSREAAFVLIASLLPQHGLSQPLLLLQMVPWDLAPSIV